MALIDVFKGAAATAFQVFDSLTVDVNYVNVTEVKWEDEPGTETLYPAKMIKENFTQKDMYSLSFSSLIQPTDIKGLIQGVDMPATPTTQDLVRVTASGQEFHVIAWETDPANALYTLLLREL